ncbi:hypothetical protein D9757_014007 [Collybiopsis confluens]|uniref:Enhancer of polycomb-like protein n=1 Tax=Collybiopsis confluens TaxID=2823264 RepID=A0A8H5M8F2_9AGAR|nr:hypothetical protein D9757_014007 [Collybiopsis confluens]
MPRPGQPPPSALRNRNRITNKTRLKVIHGNVDVDQIIPDEDEEKNRLLQIVAGVDLEDAKEHHLQAVLSEAAGVTGRKSQERPAAFIPIPEHTGLADNFSTLYPSDRWNDPVSYVQSSAVVEEYITAALADGCTYYMDERDKEWLDRNNEEARGEGTSAQGAVSPSTGRTTTRSAKAKGKEPEDVQALFMTEDEYELVMGLFEKITQEKTEFLHHSLESDTMHFPEFSEYQDILSSPLPPSTFAAYSPPSWLPEPSKLVRLARIVYPYWKERCLERAGRRIIPTLNFDESDTLNESYVCFEDERRKLSKDTSVATGGTGAAEARLLATVAYSVGFEDESSRAEIKNPSIGDKVTKSCWWTRSGRRRNPSLRQDQHWDDHVDTGYVSMMAPYAPDYSNMLVRLNHHPQNHHSKMASLQRNPYRSVHSPLKDDEAELRLAERWRFDSDDGPLYGPAGSDEHDRMLVDDYDPKYTHSLFDVADYAFLYTDPTIVRTLPDGKKENYIPYRLGITPPMNIAVPQRPASVQSQGAVPVSQQVHSVPISQHSKYLQLESVFSVSAVSNQVQSILPRRQWCSGFARVTSASSSDCHAVAADYSQWASGDDYAECGYDEAGDKLYQWLDPSQLPRPNTQLQQVHAQQSTQMQSQAAAQAQPSTVSSLHPAYAALVNANPTTYIPQYLYPTTSATGLNNQQMQHLKSVFNAANLGGVQNYNSAVFAHMQMPKAANGVVNGIPAAQNMHNFNSVNMTPVARQMQRVPSAVVNGASPSPPRPSSVVNGTMHDSNGSSSPLMNHAAVPGEPRVSTRSPSAAAAANAEWTNATTATSNAQPVVSASNNVHSPIIFVVAVAVEDAAGVAVWLTRPASASASATATATASSLLYYDWLLTFPSEVQYVWGARFSLSTVLYIFVDTRSWQMCFIFSKFRICWGQGPRSNFVTCDDWRKFVSALSVFGRAAIVVTLIGRAYAVWSRNRLILGYLTVLGTMCVVADAFHVPYEQCVATSDPPICSWHLLNHFMSEQLD